jgi:hypothetical protein
MALMFTHVPGLRAQGDEGKLELPRRLLTPLVSASQRLAKAGWKDESLEIVEILGVAGLPEKDLESLRADIRKVDPKGTKAKRASLKSVARSLSAVAKQWERELEGLSLRDTATLSRLILRLDDQSDAAHEVLGHVKTQLGWQSFEAVSVLERRAAIEDAVRRSRRLEVAVKVEVSQDPILMAAAGREGTLITYEGIRVHSSRSLESARRVFTETLRGLALSEFLLTGKLEIPSLAPTTWVSLSSKEQYLKALAFTRKQKTVTGLYAEDGEQLSAFFTDSGTGVLYDQMEADAQAGLLGYIRGWARDFRPLQPCLQAGHLNWVCLASWGTSMRGLAYIEGGGVGVGGAGGYDRGGSKEKEDRAYYLRLSRAGLAGCRSWMAWLASRGEDPPYSEAMLDEVGKITGDRLLKATIMAEYLQETHELAFLMKNSAPGVATNSGKTAGKIFEDVLQRPLPSLESAWRTWLLGTPGSIVQRIEEPASERGTDPAAALAVQELMALRNAAFDTMEFAAYDVRDNEELSAGARLHAAYLTRHPEQVKAWPDAHEQYPDKEGFTAEGARAGLRSVIAPGVKSSREALDGWMGTFYHRIPLIDPGLLAIGWGMHGSTAVLDCGSMVTTWDGDWAVKWPWDGMKKVPLAFRPELPNPVPGADQSTWGYPITIQINRELDKVIPVITMRLHTQSASGPEVPCHLSTPENPTNIEIAPAATACLIPKSRLAPSTRYFVVAELTGNTVERLVWSFTTGR